MATVKEVRVTAEVKVVLELNESEVRALDGIFGYSTDVFLKAFYEKMGKEYVAPYEAGVRSLHKTIRTALAGPLAKIEEARKIIKTATDNPQT